MEVVDVAGRLSISLFTSRTALSTFTYCDIMDSMRCIWLSLARIFSWGCIISTLEYIHIRIGKYMHLNALIYKHVNVHVRIYICLWVRGHLYRGQHIHIYIYMYLYIFFLTFSLAYAGDAFGILIFFAT